MKTEIIKQQLIETIAHRKVLAAIFNTFNFQPDFFENYVLPVLVPKLDFKNSRLYNAILWRKTKLPPTAVYYDDGVQKMPDSQAPLQDYELCPVRLPKFFHPKANYILVENEDGTKALIILLGSNNLTRAGWCENIEVATVLEVSEKANFSADFINAMIGFVQQNMEEYGNTKIAEKTILNFLKSMEINKKPASIAFYQSWQGDFETFLQRYIFDKDDIEYVEVFSPFFQKNINSSTPISILKKYIQKPIHCLIPFRHVTEIQLEKEVFTNYESNNVIWCDYKNTNQSNEGFSERYNHSKVYRFKGKKANYTVIGSVNFTTNAWNGSTKNGNLEMAILFEEQKRFEQFLMPVNLKSDWLFLDENSQQEYEGETFFKKSPYFKFTINWQNQTLEFEPIDSVGKRNFKLDITDLGLPLKKAKVYSLSKASIKSLAKNPTIKILEITTNQRYEYLYYPHQIGINQRPFLEKFTFQDIRKLWKLLSEEEIDEVVAKALERLVSKYEKADGTVDTTLIEEGIINKMAAHIDALVQLEQDLFQPHITEEKLQEFLIQDVIGSIPNYKRVYILEDVELNKGFVWVLLNIIKNQFYTRKKHPAWKVIKTSLKPIIQQLEQEIKDLERTLDIEKKHFEWAIKELRK
jgi:HKD family nuclease